MILLGGFPPRNFGSRRIKNMSIRPGSSRPGYTGPTAGQRTTLFKGGVFQLFRRLTDLPVVLVPAGRDLSAVLC